MAETEGREQLHAFIHGANGFAVFVGLQHKVDRITHATQGSDAAGAPWNQHCIEHDGRHVGKGMVNRNLLAAGRIDCTQMRRKDFADGAGICHVLLEAFDSGVVKPV